MMTWTSSPRSYLQSTGSPSFTQLIKSSTTCIALHKIFHCGNDKLTPTLVGIVSVFQNLRSTLLLPFHSVSYLPPPRGTLTGIFNAWVWSLANVTVKASCSRSPCVRLTMEHISILLPPDYILKKTKTAYSSRST
jgi:hypothetical protein